jgi:PPOX class probable F420-dependent enzyme
MTLPAWTSTSRYLALTTTRRDGRSVSTAVWFVVTGSELHVLTGAMSGKVKRIAHTPAVTVAPCDSRGRPQGASSPFTAAIRPDLVRETETAIDARYGLQAKAFGLASKIVGMVRRSADSDRTALVLTPASA